MSAKKRIALVIAVLLIASLSCEYLPGGGSEPETGDAIATSVAATMAAGEGEPGTDETAEVDPGAGETPEPGPITPAALIVLYVKDGNLYQWTEGSLPTAVTSTGDAFTVRVSRDGTRAAFTRGPDWYNQSLWAVNTDGSGLTQLVDQTTLNSYKTDPNAVSARVYQFDFIPGTHSVAFNTQLTYEGPGLILNGDLRVVDTDTSTLTTVLAPGAGGDFYFSPDGSKIGLSNPTQVSVVNADGSGRIDLLSFPSVITYSEYMYSPPLYWTPDGSALRVAIPPEDPLASAPAPTRIWHLPADGSSAVELMSLMPVPFFQHAPDLSGDTSRIAYLVEITPGSTPQVELHVGNSDGSGDVIYATGPLQFHGWADDGAHFIYTDGGANLQVGEYGGGSVALSGITELIGAEWVDDTRFLLESKPGADFQLWMGQIGSPASLIDSTPGNRISYDHNY